MRVCGGVTWKVCVCVTNPQGVLPAGCVCDAGSVLLGDPGWCPSGRGERGDRGSPDGGPGGLGLLSVGAWGALAGTLVQSPEGLGALGGGHIFRDASTAGSRMEGAERRRFGASIDPTHTHARTHNHPAAHLLKKNLSLNSAIIKTTVHHVRFLSLPESLINHL